jgi:hypothetical protein
MDSKITALLSGLVVGVALFYLHILYPRSDICIMSFFLVGIVISVLPPYSKYDSSKMRALNWKSGPADEINPNEKWSALIFMLSSILSYIIAITLFSEMYG